MSALVHSLPFQATLKLGLSGGLLLAAAGLLLRERRWLSLLLAAGGAGILLFGYGAFVPRSQLFGAVVWRGEGADKVALTFDDGPHPRYTPAVLDLLRRWNCRATFFVLGKEVEAHPELARRIVAEGHAIGSHGYSHRPFAFMSPSQLREELERTDHAIQRATGARPSLLRPPYGFRSPLLAREARRLGYRLVGWTLTAGDWRRRQAAQISGQIERELRPGDIVLLHDGRGDRRETVAALEQILRFLQRRGWRAATLPELLAGNG